MTWLELDPAHDEMSSLTLCIYIEERFHKAEYKTCTEHDASNDEEGGNHNPGSLQDIFQEWMLQVITSHNKISKLGLLLGLLMQYFKML